MPQKHQHTKENTHFCNRTFNSTPYSYSYLIKKAIQAEVTTNASHVSVECSDEHLSRVFQ